jgi:hypothetical protein
MWTFNWGVFWAVLAAILPATVCAIWFVCDQLEVVDRNLRQEIREAVLRLK